MGQGIQFTLIFVTSAMVPLRGYDQTEHVFTGIPGHRNKLILVKLLIAELNNAGVAAVVLFQKSDRYLITKHLQAGIQQAQTITVITVIRNREVGWRKNRRQLLSVTHNHQIAGTTQRENTRYNVLL